jgi:ankyrin repeat protein
MAEEAAAVSTLLAEVDVGADSARLLQSLLAALDEREFRAPEKKALEAAIDGGIDMLSDQCSDAFVDDGFEAKCQFNNAHFILSGDSDNLLVRASRRGRTESVRYLLNLGADQDECNGYGDSPLMAAAINGQVGAVRALMDAGADAYAEHQEVFGFTALIAALDRCREMNYGWPSHTIQQAQLAVVRCLLEEYEVNLKPPGLYDPLEIPSDPVGLMISISAPARPAMQELVRLLLANGAHPNDWVRDIDARHRDGSHNLEGMMTALHAACVWAHHKKDYTVVQLLVEAGGDPSQSTNWNSRSTALQYARLKRDRQLLDLLHPSWQEEGRATQPTSPPAAKECKKRRGTPLPERAERAGVNQQLKLLPDPLPKSASEAELKQHKKDVHRVQIANQQIVSRAEAALAKQRRSTM